MGLINVLRAIVVRLMFAGHGVIAIWRLYIMTSDIKSLFLGASLVGLFLESCVTLCFKNGKEWKW